MNPNDARIERVYTRLTGIDVPDETPNVNPPAAPPGTVVPNFEVVVEAIAGDVQSVTGAPFTLTISAQDVTAPSNATSPAVNVLAPGAASVFLTTLTTVAPPAPGLEQAWPAYKFVFPIPLTAANYVPGHTYQVHATLASLGFLIVSTADSPQFVLF